MTRKREDGEERMTTQQQEQPGQTRAPKAAKQVVRSSDMPTARDARVYDDREAQEREVTEDREISDDERLELFRDSLQQSVLPDLPRIDGYHTCWLSTTNGRDSIARRKQIGYTLIRVEELPHWDASALQSTGDYAGVICVNEMVAAKIPLRLYNRMMKLVHDDMPREEEGKLRAKVELMKQQATEVGSMIEEGDGMAELGRRARHMPELVE